MDALGLGLFNHYFAEATLTLNWHVLSVPRAELRQYFASGLKLITRQSNGEAS